MIPRHSSMKASCLAKLLGRLGRLFDKGRIDDMQLAIELQAVVTVVLCPEVGDGDANGSFVVQPQLQQQQLLNPFLFVGTWEPLPEALPYNSQYKDSDSDKHDVDGKHKTACKHSADNKYNADAGEHVPVGPFCGACRVL